MNCLRVDDSQASFCVDGKADEMFRQSLLYAEGTVII